MWSSQDPGIVHVAMCHLFYGRWNVSVDVWTLLGLLHDHIVISALPCKSSLRRERLGSNGIYCNALEGDATKLLHPIWTSYGV